MHDNLDTLKEKIENANIKMMDAVREGNWHEALAKALHIATLVRIGKSRSILQVIELKKMFGAL